MLFCSAASYSDLSVQDVQLHEESSHWKLQGMFDSCVHRRPVSPSIDPTSSLCPEVTWDWWEGPQSTVGVRHSMQAEVSLM